MSPARRALAVVASILIAGAVAACGSSVSPSPASSAAPSAPDVVPSGGVPSPSGAAVSPQPSIDTHGAPELEARLPKRIGGTDLSAVSLSGETFLSTGSAQSQGQLRDLLGQLGRSPDDLSVAEAHDPNGRLVFQLGLFRVAGAEPDALAAGWLAAQQAADANRLGVTQETIAGRTVTHVEDPAREVGGDTYVLAVGDTLVLVLADDRALVEEALASFR